LNKLYVQRPSWRGLAEANNHMIGKANSETLDKWFDDNILPVNNLIETASLIVKKYRKEWLCEHDCHCDICRLEASSHL